MADFKTKQGSSGVVIQARLVDKDGDAVDLTGATVKFSMRDKITHDLKVSLGTVTVLSASPPTDPEPNVEYSYTSDDLDDAGRYEGEWQVTFAGGSVQYFPDDGWNEIEVTANVA